MTFDLALEIFDKGIKVAVKERTHTIVAEIPRFFLSNFSYFVSVPKTSKNIIDQNLILPTLSLFCLFFFFLLFFFQSNLFSLYRINFYDINLYTFPFIIIPPSIILTLCCFSTHPVSCPSITFYIPGTDCSLIS